MVSIAGQIVYWRFGDKSYWGSGGVPAIALRKSIDAGARHTNSALIHVKFVTTEWIISRKIRLYRSVVAQKENQGLIKQVLILERL